VRRTWKLLAVVAVSVVALAGCLGPGTHVVSSTPDNGAVTPGIWHTFGGTCYWERLRGFSGSFDDIIANSFTNSGPQYVEIKNGDAGFHSEGCLPWAPIDVGGLDAKFPITAQGQFLGDGEYRVGVEVPAGTYQSTVQQGCYWERLNGFGGEFANIIANNINAGLVTIGPTDVGFRSQGCGVWTKIG
jgi:hypothetical protein